MPFQNVMVRHSTSHIVLNKVASAGTFKVGSDQRLSSHKRSTEAPEEIKSLQLVQSQNVLRIPKLHVSDT